MRAYKHARTPPKVASLAIISLPRSGFSSLLPRPETLLRWHRELVRRRWAAFPDALYGQALSATPSGGSAF